MSYRDALPVEEALAIIDRDVPHRLDADVRRALEIHLGHPSAASIPIELTLSDA